MHLVINTYGAKLSVYKGRFRLRSQDKLIEEKYSPLKIKSITLTTAASITTDALKLAVMNEIPIFLLDRHSLKPLGMFWSHYYGTIATLRRAQYAFSESGEATDWIMQQFERKTHRQVENLHFLAEHFPHLTENLHKSAAFLHKQWDTMALKRTVALTPELRSYLMGMEGAMGAKYFRQLSECMPILFQSPERQQNPAQNPFNACLNYLYGMLYHLVEHAILIVGFDPFLPLYHRDEYQAEGFVFDYIESFRPWADSVLIQIALDNVMHERHFVLKESGMSIEEKGRVILIHRFDDFFRQKVLHDKHFVSRKEVIVKQLETFRQELIK